MTGREALATAIGLAGGVAIAVMDSSPRYDSTAVTVFALVAVAVLASAIAGSRPWLIALLVGLATPLVEIAGGGNVASLAALLFAAVGAAGGWLLGARRPDTAT